MDPLTQAVLGGTIAEAAFRPRLGRRAVLFGAFCGMLPDIDVVAAVAGEWQMLVHHRGVTHSLLVLPLLAPALGWLGHLSTGRTGSLRSWMHLAFWALITHPLLDVFTPYGTQLLAPFSQRRFSLDAVAVIDPLYSVPLLIAVAFAFLSRSRSLSRRVALVALALTTSYLGFGFAVSQRAAVLARPQIAATGFTPVALRTPPPILFSPLRRVVARDAQGALCLGIIAPLRPRPIHFTRLAAPDDPLVEVVLESPAGRIFHWFADGFLRAEVERRQDGASVLLSDTRYGLFLNPGFSPFMARAELDATGNLLSLHRLEGVRPPDVQAELAAGWRLVRGR